MPFFPSLPEDATTKHVFTAHPEIYSHWVNGPQEFRDIRSNRARIKPGYPG
jgi:hypothetical protein